MKYFLTILFATIFGLSTTVSARLTTNPLIGKTLKFSYPKEGYEYISKYLNETHLEWKILKTPDNQPVRTGTEAYTFRKIAKNIYFISWSEANGTDVIHIIDMNESKIFAHITFKDEQNPDGRRKKLNREGFVIDQT
ncbi:hypothetical protein CONCODRAFT_74044 [Conidiobolus coronatus NRRL 28638]|uniref:MoaF-like domain-containing protein n=1 Tax=Conidiobolus coronatus (strain ATCC 28846 / CBS 209.66 / NRRL 28638) TaxID=796925 RepID=A0A137NSX2_CONC2|nr:hypothetical protein CONCODRAFT_74044 [Conidiobolus coronatus NRRL 28638]|eukprot:KXN65875.1 hypothetical protein CONCODRAFT_74044 [Conidiobolus coronatus NRRL 28638]